MANQVLLALMATLVVGCRAADSCANTNSLDTELVRVVYSEELFDMNDYVIGQYAKKDDDATVDDCPVGFGVISSEDECRAAAASFDKIWGGVCESSTYTPGSSHRKNKPGITQYTGVCRHNRNGATAAVCKALTDGPSASPTGGPSSSPTASPTLGAPPSASPTASPTREPRTPAPTPVSRDRTPSPTPPNCVCPPVIDPVCGVNGEAFQSPCAAGCAGVTVDCSGACPCEDPSATGDPHVHNLAGEHYDINQPADHLLLRVPLEPSRPAKLELRSQIRADDPSKVCATYMRMVTLRGEWFGSSTVQVRPLRRNEPGANAAGNSTMWQFSLREFTDSTGGDWRSVADFGAGGGEVQILSASVSVAARTRVEEFGSRPESEAFEFMVGGGAESRASIVVYQGQRQSLNLQLKNLKALEEQQLGGLLGSEKHSPEVEKLTQQCMSSKSSADSARLRAEAVEFRLSASW